MIELAIFDMAGTTIDDRDEVYRVLREATERHGARYSDEVFQQWMGTEKRWAIENLLPANKNIGTTHITNGCYRLHPVEWSIGESVGMLVAYALNKRVVPRAVREKKEMLADFQNMVRAQGIETHWP